MTLDLLGVLPQILPRAIAWAEAQSAAIISSGNPLTASGVALARAVGVDNPAQIRICEVRELPLPEDPDLREAALHTGLLGPQTAGLTLGYGIYICEGQLTKRLLSHECRHVHQYEQAGSISAFLPVYLTQVATYGYAEAPFEIDARQHERHGA